MNSRQINKFFFVDLVTIPTFQNHRIIASRLYSKIRSPSLLGEIILHLVLLVPLAAKINWPSIIGIVFIVAYLVIRSIVIGRRNAKKYGSSWTKYTALVKYDLLPRVY